ncbi:MAG: DUF2478 domain-containing protein [Terasakiella sp.]|uniref:DUF2478 domain-containing protein n=1 Tax=unclassified Terasakiella TaxID=2614952 RepID=UPI003B009348
MSTQTAKPIRLGGVLYAADTPKRNALLDFATNLQKRGWHVCGLTQELAYDNHGEKIGLDAIDIKTGERFALARPSKEDRAAGSCGFDVSRLCDTSKVLNNAIDKKADLLVVEKFGEREQDGNGLAQEIIAAALAGIPTLVAVPASALETWNDFTGRLGTLLPHDTDKLWDWWPKCNLYKDLSLEVPDIPVQSLTIGPETILIETAFGCGAAPNPSKTATMDTPSIRSLRDLALKIHQDANPLDHALGCAALLAYTNRYDQKGINKSGLDHFKGSTDSILVVGNFPRHHDYAAQVNFMSTDKALPHLSTHAYDGMILPAHTFFDASLPLFLNVKGNAHTLLVGPMTPLSPRLFNYGIDMLCARIIENPAEAKAMVRTGASVNDLKKVSRYITLEKQ